jgi:hypothetical protein
MLESIIAANFNELTVTDIPKGVHEEGLNPACGRLSFLPNPLKGMGPRKDIMEGELERASSAVIGEKPGREKKLRP